MQLPDPIQELLNEILDRHEIHSLEEGSQHLSAKYRAHNHNLNAQERLAYLAVRMPATFSALYSVFSELKNYSISSILDLGSGPATASIAAKELFDLTQITCIEKESEFISFGKKLLNEAHWIEKNFSELATLPEHDCVVFSYSYGEYQNPAILSLAWQAAKQALIIVEPGTVKGYHTMLNARDILIGLGGYVIAPCPHSKKCPMQPPDWCHFPARVERSFLHKRLKQGSLSFEDEKFSYVIIGKEKPQFPHPRILQDPAKRSGHIYFNLCCENGIEKRIVSKKEGEIYKAARKKEWGDCL